MKLKKFLQFNENMDMKMDMDMTHEHDDSENTYYMFFQNLSTIKRLVDKLLEMDETEIDEILVSGHDWAADHIAVAKVDVEQVFNFLTHNTEEDHDDNDMNYMTNMPNMTGDDDNDMDDDDMDDDDMEDFSSDEDYDDEE